MEIRHNEVVEGFEEGVVIFVVCLKSGFYSYYVKKIKIKINNIKEKKQQIECVIMYLFII